MTDMRHPAAPTHHGDAIASSTVARLTRELGEARAALIAAKIVIETKQMPDGCGSAVTAAIVRREAIVNAAIANAGRVHIQKRP